MKTLKLRWNYVALSIVAALAFSLSSCEKSQTDVIDDSETALEAADLKLNTAIDESTVSNAFDEIDELADEVYDNLLTFAPLELKAGNGHQNRHKDTLRPRGPNMRHLAECATIIRDINATRDTMIVTIDFGEECISENGKVRSGKIIMTRFGHLYWTGSTTSTITFEDYFVDGNQILGSKIKEGIINDAGNRQHTTTVIGEMILADDAGTVTWNANRVREVIEGSDTRNKRDDKVQVTGSSSGVSADGSVYSSVIVEPLIRIHEEGCWKHYVSGIVFTTKGADTEITIDYGDGTCDNLAEVTTNGVTETIELGKRKPRP
jgi:hypothetical protein